MRFQNFRCDKVQDLVGRGPQNLTSHNHHCMQLVLRVPVTPPESVTVIPTTIPLLKIITVVDQAMINYDHSSVRIPP